MHGDSAIDEQEPHDSNVINMPADPVFFEMNRYLRLDLQGAKVPEVDSILSKISEFAG
jgi:hypothetical protein